MTDDWTAPAWAVLAVLAALVLLAGVLTALLVSARRRTRAALRAVLADSAALRDEVAAAMRRLERPEPATADVEAAEFVITEVGSDAAAAGRPAGEAVPALPAPLFADLVLRESVVQAASLAHGLRRALSPEARHRIRFHMRQEVKRSRRHRRAELRAARRLLAARERASLAAEAEAEARAAS